VGAPGWVRLGPGPGGRRVSWGLVAALVVALLAAAFAASAETSLTSLSRLRLRARREEGDPAAAAIERLHRRPNGYLGAILVTNTVAVIVASTAATLLAVQSFGRSAAFWSTVALSVVVLMACEIGPKTYALQHSERVARVLVRPVAVLTLVLGPLVALLTAVPGLLTRVGAGGSAARGPFLSEGELKMLVAVGEEEGVVEEGEREMINGIFEMTDKAAREVMVPRVEMAAIEVARPLEEAIQLVLTHGHSRIPVYEETIDNIVGVVYAKDLLRARTRAAAGSGEPALREVARRATFTPESKRVGELLHEMQRANVHLVIVVDEYGGTAGLATIEDVLEEIVGPIRDEYDQAEAEEVQILAPAEALVSARASLDDVNEILRLQLSGDDFDSLGGYVYARLGRIPTVGDTIDVGDDVTLTVEAVRRQSIRTIRVRSRRPFGPPDLEEPEHEPERDPAPGGDAGAPGPGGTAASVGAAPAAAAPPPDGGQPGGSSAGPGPARPAGG